MALRTKIHLPQLFTIGPLLSWFFKRALRMVYVQVANIKTTRSVVLFFLFSIFSPFFSPPRFSEPSRATKRDQVFIDHLFKKVGLTRISTKMKESNQYPSNKIKLHSQGTSHVSVYAVFTRHALRNKRL